MNDAVKSQMEAIFEPSDKIAYRGPQLWNRFSTPTHETTFFCINPVKNPLGRIVAENITSFRNILVEMDGISLGAQERLVKRIGLPFTTQTFSGGKSFHFIMSLEQPLKDLEAYCDLTKAIYAIVKRMDPSCKNPNRLSRVAGIMRPDKGVEQELVEVRKRVTTEELRQWLFVENAMTIAQLTMPRVKADPLAPEQGPSNELTNKTKRFLEEGIFDGSRHAALLSACVNMWACGWTEEAIREACEPVCEELGIADRGDLDSVLTWVTENVSQDEASA
jgi:hypothetical protein